MRNYKKYQALTDSINALAGHYDFTDMCVDAENCDHPNDDSEEFWALMLLALHNSAGMRISEAGLNHADFGVEY